MSSVTKLLMLLSLGVSQPLTASGFGALQASLPLDQEFGRQGEILLPEIGASREPHFVGIKSARDKVVIAYSGERLYSNGPDTIVMRLHGDGSKDISFGSNGETSIAHFIVSGNPTSLQIDEVGRIVLAGVATKDGTERSAIIRLDVSGRLDTSFGDQGVARMPESFPAPAGLDIDLNNGGYFVLSGTSAVGGTTGAVQVAYLWDDGSFVERFGVQGIATIRSSDENGFGTAIRSLDSGEILVAGLARGGNAFVDRVEALSGRVVQQTELKKQGADFRVFNIEVTDGKYLLLWKGFGFGYTGGHRITKHHINGQLDQQFGFMGGVWGVDFGTPEAYITAGILRKNGSIAISGFALSQPYGSPGDYPWGLGVVGYSAKDGSPDLSWCPILGRAYHIVHDADLLTYAMTELADESLMMVGQRWDRTSGIGVLALWKLK